MIGLLLQLLAVSLAAAGFVALALAMDRHHAAVVGGPASPPRRRLLRAAGTLALSASAALCIGAWGWIQGAVGLWGVFALGAACVMLWLRWRESGDPRRHL